SLMPKLFDLKLPVGCRTLPEGFWSAVDVWIKKPHVVNKRLCGVKETEAGEEEGRGTLRSLLDSPGLSHEVLSFLSPPAGAHGESWSSSSVRTFIPKVSCYGTNLQKELILKDFDRQQVTFLPFEEDAEGQVSLKRGNIHQVQLLHQDCEEWALELHALAPDAWFSDGVAYPKLRWLSSDLLPKLARWATECKSSEFRSTLSLLPVEKYSLMYQQLKDKYKAMVKVKSALCTSYIYTVLMVYHLLVSIVVSIPACHAGDRGSIPDDGEFSTFFVVASVLFYTVVCWGGSISKKDTSRLDKLIRRAGSVVGTKLDSLVTVAESRTLDKLLDIMDNASHPLHTVISNQRSLFSERLLLPKCRTNRLKNSFVWPEVTDPEKFVYEDVAIATYLLVLWAEERAERGQTARQSFVDLGCGNGLLVHILTNEGHPGKGIDVRKEEDLGHVRPPHSARGVFSAGVASSPLLLLRAMLNGQKTFFTLKQEKPITPSASCLFPGTDWLIGNHSDELTPWIPVIAARRVISRHNLTQQLKCQLISPIGNNIMGRGRMCECVFAFCSHCRSSHSCRYFVLPCCFFDFYGKYQRRQCKKSQYKEYIDFIAEVSQVSGFDTEEDCLRIPSTKRVCLVGKSRNYQLADEAEAEQRRAHYIQSRQTPSGVTVQGSDITNDCCHGNKDTDGTPGSSWGAGFQPRDRVEAVRNCAALPRAFVNAVVLQVANALLGMAEDDGGGASSDWNRGGSLSVSEVAGLLGQETLQLLKKECGGLQTLLKNNHQVFRVEGGRVYIRDWRDRKPSGTDTKRKPVAPGALKTRPCWFHDHHPQRCPLQAEHCAFAHGPDDLRPSTRPLKKIKNEAFSLAHPS
ncbi:hypothetical protein L3Q82_016891, partial [Scortum barcoo]